MTHYILRNIGCLSALLLLPLSASSKITFRTQELSRLSTVLSIHTEMLHEGYNYPVAQGKTLTVHVSNNIVDHIGIRLFSEEIRALDKSPVFDFLERYFLQLNHPPVVKTASNMLRDDQFKFIKGNLHTVDLLQPTDGFTYQFDRYRYVATWSRGGQTLLAVSFPVEYELMSGENKIEAENLLMDDVLGTPIQEENDIITEIRNETYISSDFSNRLYFREGELLLSSKHPAESAANMMLTPNTPGDYQLHLTQRMYGFRKTDFLVPLRQWLSFCLQHGCKLYFAVENISAQGEIEAVVLAVNTAENYNHVLTVNIPSSLIAQHKGTIEAQLYPYVPTHNVMNLFSNAYKKSNKKTFVNK